mgnify:CR=1 FL=1
MTCVRSFVLLVIVQFCHSTEHNGGFLEKMGSSEGSASEWFENGDTASSPSRELEEASSGPGDDNSTTTDEPSDNDTTTMDLSSSACGSVPLLIAGVAVLGFQNL